MDISQIPPYSGQWTPADEVVVSEEACEGDWTEWLRQFRAFGDEQNKPSWVHPWGSLLPPLPDLRAQIVTFIADELFSEAEGVYEEHVLVQYTRLLSMPHPDAPDGCPLRRVVLVCGYALLNRPPPWLPAEQKGFFKSALHWNLGSDGTSPAPDNVDRTLERWLESATEEDGPEYAWCEPAHADLWCPYQLVFNLGDLPYAIAFQQLLSSSDPPTLGASVAMGVAPGTGCYLHTHTHAHARTLTRAQTRRRRHT